MLDLLEYISGQVSCLCFPDGCHIFSRAAGLTSVMAQEITCKDVSKQIRICTGPGAPARNILIQLDRMKNSCGVISLDMLTSLDPANSKAKTVRMDTSKEGSLIWRKRIK